MLEETGPNTSVINNHNICRYTKLSEKTEIFRLYKRNSYRTELLCCTSETNTL